MSTKYIISPAEGEYMAAHSIQSTFPEITAIEDDRLKSNVVDAWATSMREHGIEDLTDVPWLPPTQRALSVPDESLVDHTRDVTSCAVALAETLSERRDGTVSPDMDTVIAGSLVHDVSKLAEFDGMEGTDIYDLLGHPYYGVHIAARANLGPEYAHIILSHTDRTQVEPATIEAALVKHADEIAASAIRWQVTADLRTV